MKLPGLSRCPLKVVLLAYLGVGMGCNSPKALTQADGVVQTTQTLNSVGVKGIATSAIRYPATGLIHAAQHTALASTWLQHCVGGPRARPESLQLPPAGTHADMDVATFEALLDRKLRPPRASGKVRLLIDGDEYFPRLSQLLRETREPVDVQLYIFDRDDFAVQMADEIKQTSQRVPVRVLFDDLGSLQAGHRDPDTPPPQGFKPPKDIARYLEEGSRIEVRKLHNILCTSTHTKIITFGPSLAHIGGMNIGREYRSEWHDLMAEVRGPVVGLLQKEVDRCWRRASPLGDWQDLWASGGKGRPQTGSEEPLESASVIRVFRTRPFDFEIQKAIHLGIDNAQRRVWIENPYFADDTIVRKLINARRRGVDVRVVLPSEAGSRVLDENNEATAAVMIQHGIRVFIYPRMTHVKAGLFDGWAIIGSANYDHLSLRMNGEVNIGYSDPEAIRELEERLFITGFKASQERKTPPPTNGTAYLSEIAADAL